MLLAKGAQQWDRRRHLSYRNRMQPDGIRRRPKKRLREQSQPFGEAGKVFTPFCYSPDKVGDDKRRRKQLD
jgi:hypothetical protein